MKPGKEEGIRRRMEQAARRGACGGGWVRG